MNVVYKNTGLNFTHEHRGQSERERGEGPDNVSLMLREDPGSTN